MPEQPVTPTSTLIELVPLPSLTELTRQFWRDLLGGRIRVPDAGEPTPDRGNGSGSWEE